MHHSHNRRKFDRLDPSYKLTRYCCKLQPQKGRTGMLRVRSIRSAIFVTVLTTCPGTSSSAFAIDLHQSRMQRRVINPASAEEGTPSDLGLHAFDTDVKSRIAELLKFFGVPAFFTFCFSLFTFHFSPFTFHFSLLVLGSAAKSARFTLTARKGQRKKRITSKVYDTSVHTYHWEGAPWCSAVLQKYCQGGKHPGFLWPSFRFPSWTVRQRTVLFELMSSLRGPATSVQVFTVNFWLNLHFWYWPVLRTKQAFSSWLLAYWFLR
jgi:hypothetical protein